MQYLIFLVVLTPLIGACCVTAMGRKSEKTISTIVLTVSWIFGLSVLSLLVVWARGGFSPFEWEVADLYRSEGYNFPLVFYFDRVSAFFLAVTTYMYLVIARFSRYYMHRESGYARFFSTILLFIFGMSFLVTAGTVDLLFAGWEVVGISSFLLIAFYRQRITPVRNAMMAYGVYRVCDVGVLLGAWLAHLIWHKSEYFSRLQGAVLSGQGHDIALLCLSLLILLAAAGKSAQFPFCFWLPRAMEGPTPSSAIFYGALSVHVGVFLLMRTYPIWSAIDVMPWCVGSIGLISALLGSLSGRSQSNIKGQIAYSSIAQVGLMLVELALGYPTIALVHFVGNAGLRSYQLLVSPSVVAYILRMQGTPGAQRSVSEWSIERILPNSIRSTLYSLSFNEGYLIPIMQLLVVRPLARLGRFVHRIDGRGGRSAGVLLGTVLVLASHLVPINGVWFAGVAAFLAVAASLSSLAERQLALRAWNAVGFSCLFSAVAILLSAGHVDKDVAAYLLGIVPPWIIGISYLKRLCRALPQSFQLDSYWGRVADQPKDSFIFFLCFLGLAGFPIGPAFIGEDALLHHAVGNNLWLAIVFVFAFIVNGISLARLYSRVNFGPKRAAFIPTAHGVVH